MKKKKPPILFIYPTQYRVTGVPIGIASIIAVLHTSGFEMRVFDTAFYPGEGDLNQNELRARKKMSKAVVNENVLPDNETNLLDDVKMLVEQFKPAIIAVSLLQPTFNQGMNIVRHIKKIRPEVFVVAGGVFPTLFPDFVFQEKDIDAICLGEGEEAMLQLCHSLAGDGEPVQNTPGMWIKWQGTEFRNSPKPVLGLENLPYPDFSLFDPRLFYKPMQGKLYRMINIETTRGCPYQCTYCSAPSLQIFFRKNNCGTYYRKLSMNYIIEQIKFQAEKYKAEFIYFSSEMFLSFSNEEFAQFIEEYSKIRIPFWFQTRFETVTLDRITALKEIGMFWLTLGLEHGNEEFRKNVLKRNYKNEVVINAIKILRQAGVGASINNIIGIPGETREDIFDTINLNRRLHEINPLIESNVFMFTPFWGSELYKVCRREGLITDREKLTTASLYRSEEKVLNYSDEWLQELGGLSRTFNLYIKLPKKYFRRITLAEHNTSEGNSMLHELLELI